MNDNKTAGLIIALLLMIIGLPISALVYAYSLSWLWLWFVVPLGVPAIGMAHAYGLMVLKNLVWFKYAKDQEKSDDLKAIFVKYINVAFTAPLVCLGFGYLVHTFFM